MTTTPPAANEPSLPDETSDAARAAATRRVHVTDSGWQALPAAARALCLLDALPLWASLGLGAGFGLGVLGAASGPSWWLGIGAVAGALIGAVFGLYRGAVRFASTRWRLDADGLGVRHDRMWQVEVRVPGSRVQHLDLQRGPLQRRRGLATLVVHTAGSAHGAVRVAHLSVQDADLLREALGQPLSLDPEPTATHDVH